MKKTVSLISIILIFLLLAGCTPKELKFDIDKATKITIFSGSMGKSVEITDEQQISHITDNFNELTFTKQKSSKSYDGFAYSITWYDSDNNKIEAITVMRENRISYNDYFYHCNQADASIDIAYLMALFDNFVE